MYRPRIILALFASLIFFSCTQTRPVRLLTLECGGNIAAPLLSVPALRNDMSPTVIRAYVWLDSVMRHRPTDSYWDRLDSLQSKDSFLQMRKLLYAAEDYDPILYKQYCSVANEIDNDYWGSPATAVFRFEDKVAELLHDPQLAILFSAICILQIHVNDVSRRLDTSSPHQMLWRGCVDAIIQDTIKGHVRATVDGIHIMFIPAWSKSGSDMWRSFQLGRKGKSDTIIYRSDAFGWNTLEAGKDYIVLLDVTYDRPDDGHDAIAMRPIMDGVGGVYPIVQGVVNDSLNNFGMGKAVPVEEFKLGLRKRIDVLLNR